MWRRKQHKFYGHRTYDENKNHRPKKEVDGYGEL
jgi:hypothetical protein